MIWEWEHRERLTISAHNEFTAQWFRHYFNSGGNCGRFLRQKKKKEQFLEDSSGYCVWNYLERSETEDGGL